MKLIKKWRIRIEKYSFGKLDCTYTQEMTLEPTEEDILTYYQEVKARDKYGSSKIIVEPFYIVQHDETTD